ncbi:hypothetical protein B9Z55_025616 [Caenorhabditis nigoni]|uniref:Uncharacterized protein n=1 Tax=Caenorhabditis nigoni TaxID=1611254 RepID=A0A2G5SZK9_9PELO|nr:hypothetical protein B9Z55_025616 [Caenorhabditis nigoni]
MTTYSVIYTGFYSATICLIAIQFMYRYWAVFDENKLIFFEGWRSLIWVVYLLYFGAQWAIGAYNFVKTDEVARNYFREEMILRYNVSVDDLPSLAMVAFDPKSGDIRWWNLMTVVNMSFIMTIQYAIMIHCGYSMFAKMEEKLQNFSTTHKNHHKQIFKTLMLQPVTLLTMADSYLPWVTLSHAIAIFGFFSSIIAGSILTFLNVFCVGKVFGSYKYLVIIFTCVGMVFATFEVIFSPNMHSFNGATIYFTLSRPFGLSTNVMSVSIVVYSGLYAATICLIAVQFIYRYWAVFDENKLEFFQGWRSLIWVAYVLYFGAQWAIGAYIFGVTDEVARNYIREEMMLRYNANVDDLPILASVAFDPTTGDVRWRNVMTILNMSLIMTIQYAIMIHCGYSMFVKMEEKLQNFSTSHRNHHKQLFKTLLLQDEMGGNAYELRSCDGKWIIRREIT